MSTTHRLPPQPGEWIDRGRPLSFRFEGRKYTGYAGDTLTSALAANGVRLLGRSFKYHRPRGIVSMANHDANCMVQNALGTNIRADVTPLAEGADFRAVNTLGGLRSDWGRLLDHLSAFLPVGFYYKTFHRPRRLFPFWERQMRAMAGLGAIDPRHPRLRTPKAYDFCDVLVVGAGPAGLSAALAAARHGCRVVVVDEHPRPGGSLHYQWVGQGEGAGRLRELLAGASRLAILDLRTATLAAGCYADFWVALVDEQRMTKMRAACLVVAAGCFEQPAVFGNNDLPGVMLASAAQRLIHQFAVKPFQRGVVLAGNADGYRAALDLAACGIQLAAVIDLRPEGEAAPPGRRVAEAGIPVHAGHAVYEAIAARGKVGIKGVVVCPLDSAGRPRTDQAFRLDCDGIAMSVGWAPADGLVCQAGGRMGYCERLEQFIPQSLPGGLLVAGRANGVYALDDQIADGERAGKAAAAYLGRYTGTLPAPSLGRAGPSSHPYPVVVHPTAKAFVDLDEDVQYKDFVHAAQEGFDHVELMKRYSTYGMGPSQGKTANTNAIRILARIKGQTVAQTGTTTSRPFVQPVPLSHLAGRGFHPRRRTPLHGRHQAAGAQFMPAAEWLRPAYYAVPHRTPDEAIAEEVQAVRQRVGVIDVGTLGKLEISGPDAAEFIERIYTGRFARMKIGTTRYGLMCDESGVVIDDGVVGRLAEDRFYVTTTTTASGSVYREMQRWALVWGLEVVLVNATGSLAAMNVAGPKSRRILAELSDLDVREESFAYLGLREGKILGVAARFLRTGFVGEVGYEIHVAAPWAARVWDGVLQAGQPYQIRPFGVEAQRILRLEKGHVIVSQDTDGLSTPFEAGLDWAVKADKPYFVGGRSLAILGARPLKRRLVGFALSQAHGGPLPKECHLVIEEGQITGRVTSIALSPTLQRVIGLAYVNPAQAAPGSVLQIRADGGTLVPATVVEMPFYDPKNVRQTLVAPPPA